MASMPWKILTRPHAQSKSQKNPDDPGLLFRICTAGAVRMVCSGVFIITGIFHKTMINRRLSKYEGIII